MKNRNHKSLRERLSDFVYNIFYNYYDIYKLNDDLDNLASGKIDSNTKQ